MVWFDGVPYPTGPLSSEGSGFVTVSDRDRRRRELSQNFLVSQTVVDRLVAAADIRPGKKVLDIGAGKGVLVARVRDEGGAVLAIEPDPTWAKYLRDRFSGDDHVTVAQARFEDLDPPREPFRVVANLPFGSTTSILRGILTAGVDLLVVASLLVQLDYSKKRAGKYGGNLFNMQWLPWFEFQHVVKVGRKAFRPVPAVDAGHLVIRPRQDRPLGVNELKQYQAFVQQGYAARGRDLVPTLTGSGSRSRVLAAFGGVRDSGIELRATGSDQVRAKDLPWTAWVELYEAGHRQATVT